ncbi:MAG: 23S rRNA (adenine(2503)-C(2))-methyltransferase RlmN [Erysipelotrichaceae bacterium]
MKSMYDFTFSQLQDLMLEHGAKKFHGQQIFEWLYRKRITDLDQMSNVAASTRSFLKEHYNLKPLTLVTKQVSKDGTTKYLFALEDGYLIETVLMLYDYGRSVCVTSQVGCNMGCTFCASGLLKKKRDLTSGEMVAQVMAVQKDLDEAQERVSHVVVMGTGEPFDNYDHVLNFLAIINHDRGLAIGARHLTISTSGIVPKIRTFADGGYQYNLAISLHAPNDALRNKLMPINQAYPLNELIDALRYYSEKNNRRLTFEYILLKGVNDLDEHVNQLAKLLHGVNAYVNLIPYNEVDEHGFKSVDRKNAMIFYDKLMKKGVRCTIRKEHGGDIDAACGQLRAKHEQR